MIGKKLKELIKLRNIKQIKLAKYVGISPSRLSNYLSDKREPDIEMLAKMARYLSVDLNYFTDVRFPAKKDAAYPVTIPEDSVAMEGAVAYVTTDDSAGTVDVPFMSINSKKRAAKTKVVSVSRLFLGGVKDPAANATMFEVTTGIGGDNFRQGDYILAARYNSVKVNNGALVFETGRNGKAYRYLEDKGKYLLLAEDTKEIETVSKDDLSAYYTILWVISRP